MTILRVRYSVQGGHVHCRVFTAPGVNLTFAKCGDLVFNVMEWPEVEGFLKKAGAQVLQDGVFHNE